ncbi:hypothetical protein GCM10023219_10550 [Stakelama sediminis]|uniref:Lipoprotein n=1 Tax=Stakelama sediminis TaxID=463200 RepID=A0A840YW58_9SPHN|nr:hypothetical protein [Stakelama sediminis]MBB5717779.1 hypothetical protein [Stakelama sediminis]
MIRILLILATMPLLSGCMAYGRTNRPSPPSENGVFSTDPQSGKVGEWTRKQRYCEVGERKKQRRCVMRYPGDGG